VVDKLLPKEEMARLLVVDAAALPDVFAKVVEAKRLLTEGKASTAADAARRAGISRSAFYKYKDAVYAYEWQPQARVLTVHALLRDEPGSLSRVLAAFAQAGTNILTVNQNMPINGAASVSVAARIDGMQMTTEAFVRSLAELEGVQQIVQFSSGVTEKASTPRKGRTKQ